MARVPRKNVSHALYATVALLFATCASQANTTAAEEAANTTIYPRIGTGGPDSIFDWRIRRDTAERTAAIMGVLTGWVPDPGACKNLFVGPLTGVYSAQEAWRLVTRPLCVPSSHEQIVKDADANPLGQRRFSFHVERIPRAKMVTALGYQVKDLLIWYYSNDTEEEQELVGPIIGEMSINEALNIVISGRSLVQRWADSDLVSIEPIPHRMCEDVKVCPIIEPPPSESVTVIRSRIPQLTEFISAPVLVADRKRISETGAATLPDLLNYLSQTAYSFPAGASRTGAQYAYLRGFGPENTLVLINGRRVYSSAADLATSAFDLRAVPLSAVERIEISTNSVSVAHGSDGIGGVLNIILKREVEQPTVELRYEGADGGARQRIATVSAGINGQRGHAAVFMDYREIGGLLGKERERWRDQNYERFGGADQRSRFSAPANVSSIDGQALLGLDSPTAAVRLNPETSQLELQPGENLESLTAYTSIVPQGTQASISAIAEWQYAGQRVIGEALLVRRAANFISFPNIIAGVWGADHPQNPFHTPVIVEALLTAHPSVELPSESDLVRLVAGLSGRLKRWDYEVSATTSEENAKEWDRNATDPMRIAQALSGTGEGDVLNILALSPGEGNALEELQADPVVDETSSAGKQIVAIMRGTALTLPGGDVKANLGLEWRNESFVLDAGERSREIRAVFAQMRIPLVDHWEATTGARLDDYSDLGTRAVPQFTLKWQPYDFLSFYWTRDKRLRPPSLWDLYFPRRTAPAEIYDPRRNAIVPVTFISGGNPDLKPTGGSSTGFGISAEDAGRWRVSVDRWQMRMHDRVSLLPFRELLANEADAGDRVVRAPPSTTDIEAGLPGPITSIDISLANVGAIVAKGFDLSAHARFQTRVGELTPRLNVTWTDEFRDKDLPLPNSKMTNRAGRAHPLGTIAGVRVVASLVHEHKEWTTVALTRCHSSYMDWNTITNSRTGRRIPSTCLWDLNVSKAIAEHATIKIGATDILDQAPPYSEVNAGGFDMSLRDLTGRSMYLQITGAF